MPQPYLEPTRPRWSRNTHRSGVLGSTSSPIARSSPLTLMCMGSPPVFRTGANFDSADFGVQDKTGQKRLISLSFWHELQNGSHDATRTGLRRGEHVLQTL